MPSPPNREVVIFNAALELPASQRGAYLQEACADDPALRLHIEDLLRVHEQAGAFMETPAPESQESPGEAAAPAATISFAVAPSEKPGDRIGRYKLLEQIGEGGCGVVYMAEQEEPVRRRVALKVIKLGMDTRQVIARFEAERQALALMDHPNIAKVFDAGATEAGRPYFVMELIKGVPITRYCDENNLSTATRLGLFVQVCQAIQHAHQKGIIHRDIKPSNVLVADHDGVPVPKVIDFGIAKATTDQRLTNKTVFTAFEQFMGTAAYMSPEQARLSGMDIDTRSDIYSLGVLLYELLTGKTPFEAKRLLEAGLDEVRRIIRDEEPPRPSTRLHTLDQAEQTTTAKHRKSDLPKLVHLLSGDLDWIVMKALEKDRGRRYETANGLAMDIQRHLNSEPVVARPPSGRYRFQKMVRRNQVVFTAASAVTLALIAGLGFSSWSFLRERKAHVGELAQHRTADEQRQRAVKREAEVSRLLYVADMNLAQQAWDQNNMPRLQQLLEETQDYPDHGFEWFYWQRQSHLALKTLRGHLDSVNSVAFSRDGYRVVTGSSDGTAKVWEAASGRELFTLKGHSSPINSVDFSADGLRIVTGSWDATAKVWDAASGQELLTLKGHHNWIWSVAFSPNGQRIVTGSWDHTAKVWDAASGKELLTLKGYSTPVSFVAFSPDSKQIVSSWDGTARVWDTASGKEFLTLQNPGGAICSAAFSPDGQRIVTGSVDQTAKVWAATSGKELLTLRGHSGTIFCVGFSADGQRILTGSGDQTARVWDAVNGKQLLTFKGHAARILSVAFSRDGEKVVTGSWDHTAKVWNAVSDREPLTLKGHADRILSVAFSPDGKRVVTGSWDDTAKVWNAANGKELFTLRGHRSRINSVAFSPDGQRIVTGSSDDTAKLWEASSGKQLLTLKGHINQIYSVAFSPNSLWIVTVGENQTAKVWDATSGKAVLTLKGQSVAFSPDGQRIVTGIDQTAKVWEAISGRELLTLKGHSNWILSVAFSPDGKRIVTGSKDQTAKVWETTNGKELLTLMGHGGPVQSAVFSPDGKRIVTGSEDQTAKVWEAASGRELLTLQGHSAMVVSVAFSPDGQRIVTGSEDQTAKVWEAATDRHVATWQEEERAAAQYLAVPAGERTAKREGEQRERTEEQERQRMARLRDEGAIKRWLILAPIALGTGQSGAEGLDIGQIEDEARLRPKAGERRTIGGAELKWREVVLEDYMVDLNALLGRETTQSVAYAVCYLRSEAEQHGLQMLLGSDDESKVYLNAKQIYKSPIIRGFVADQDRVQDITLKTGLNVLVFKLVNEVGDWKGSIRFTDAQGNPVKGLKVTLTP